MSLPQALNPDQRKLDVSDAVVCHTGALDAAVDKQVSVRGICANMRDEMRDQVAKAPHTTLSYRPNRVTLET